MSIKKISRIVCWFPERNYGFLCGDAENPDGYFLHSTDVISGVPAKNAFARFEVIAAKKGFAAINAEIFASRQEINDGGAQ